MPNLPLSQAVTDTIGRLKLAEADQAVIKLVCMYAEAIDTAGPDWQIDVLNKLGPKLLTALTELGATPKARAALKTPATVESGQLQTLRSARSA